MTDMTRSSVRRAAEVEPVCFDLVNAARYIDVPAETLRAWLRNGTVPIRRIKVGARVLIARADLDAWLAAQREREP